jgi:hypothetical protein
LAFRQAGQLIGRSLLWLDRIHVFGRIAIGQASNWDALLDDLGSAGGVFERKPGRPVLQLRAGSSPSAAIFRVGGGTDLLDGTGCLRGRRIECRRSGSQLRSSQPARRVADGKRTFTVLKAACAWRWRRIQARASQQESSRQTQSTRACSLTRIWWAGASWAVIVVDQDQVVVRE